MIPNVMAEEMRRIFRKLGNDLADSNNRLIDAEFDPGSDELDIRRARQDRDECEAAMVAMLRELGVGPRDPNAWGGRYRGHRMVIVRDTAFILVEKTPGIGLDRPVILHLPIEAILVDDLKGDAELLSLGDTLAAADPDRD